MNMIDAAQKCDSNVLSKFPFFQDIRPIKLQSVSFRVGLWSSAWWDPEVTLLLGQMPNSGQSSEGKLYTMNTLFKKEGWDGKKMLAKYESAMRAE